VRSIIIITYAKYSISIFLNVWNLGILEYDRASGDGYLALMA